MSADYPSFGSLLGDDYDGVYQADNLYLSDNQQTMIHSNNNNYSCNDLLSATSTFPGGVKQDSNSSSWISDILSLQVDDFSLCDDHQQTLLLQAAKTNNNKNEGGKKRRQRKNIIKEGDQADDSKKTISSKAGEGCVVYVRAKRGQATDTHSLAERVRRQLISDKMKLLQSLVPGCDKMIGKRLILDEIINYIHSLQTHVQFLKTSLALIDPMFSLTNHALDSLTIHQQDPAYASLQCSTVPRECSSLHDEIRYDSVAPSSTALTSSASLTLLQEYGHYNSMLQN